MVGSDKIGFSPEIVMSFARLGYDAPCEGGDSALVKFIEEEIENGNIDVSIHNSDDGTYFGRLEMFYKARARDDAEVR